MVEADLVKEKSKQQIVRLMKRLSIVGTIVLGTFVCMSECLTLPIRHCTQEIRTGYQRRCAADPAFPIKSLTEVILAAGTQLAAEYKRRGSDHIITEVDFVVAGVLTAIYGKYASMWKVAATKEGQEKFNDSSSEPKLGKMKVPTNAFQPYLLDGVTRPTSKQRIGSLLLPIVPLFRAGVAASFCGYGMTAILIVMRSYFVPTYIAATRNVNILYASLYTGGFMAIVSNLRYQILQGVIEPFVAKVLKRIPLLQAALIFGIRVANGLLGPILAISGMQILGLQKLK